MKDALFKKLRPLLRQLQQQGVLGPPPSPSTRLILFALRIAANCLALLRGLSSLRFLARHRPVWSGFLFAPLPQPDQPAFRNTLPAQPAQRSILLVNHSYFYFYHLAAALRARGWDALSVSLDPPDSPSAPLFQGVDLSLYAADSATYHHNLASFFHHSASRFAMVQFTERGALSLFPDNRDSEQEQDLPSWDVAALKARGIKIGYTVSGCADGLAQSTWRQRAPGVCDLCAFRDQDAVCSDARNLGWGRKLYTYCDLVVSEMLPALDWMSGPKVVQTPLTMGVEPNLWHPQLQVPLRYRLSPRRDGEVIVMHPLNVLPSRSANTPNIKGSHAVIQAVERLRAEGVAVRLELVTGVPASEMRYYQVQADIIVDQLYFGIYGSNARESLMLGKPVISRLLASHVPAHFLQECPVVSADVDTIYPVLKELVGDPGRREALGRASREFALRWHSCESCAERFEQVYDRLMLGLDPLPADQQTPFRGVPPHG